MSMPFEVENISLHLESILLREIELHHHHFAVTGINITGSASPASLGLFLSQLNSKKINDLPHLVVCEDESSALALKQALTFFDPLKKSTILAGHEVSPYLGIYPSPKHAHDRLNFLFQCHHAKSGDIFIAPAAALFQKTLPYQVLHSKLKKFEIGTEIPPSMEVFLNELGYSPAPMVEDAGTYSIRGGIIDIYTPSMAYPVRIELFGDQIESLRTFHPGTQRTLEVISSFTLMPAREFFFDDDTFESTVDQFRAHLSERSITHADKNELLRSLIQKTAFPGMEFLLPFFYKKLETVIEHFSTPLNVWLLNDLTLGQKSDHFSAELKSEYSSSEQLPFALSPAQLFITYGELQFPEDSRIFKLNDLEMENDGQIAYHSRQLREISLTSLKFSFGSDPWLEDVENKIRAFKKSDYRIFVSFQNLTLMDRLRLNFEKMNLVAEKVVGHQHLWATWLSHQDRDKNLIHFIPHAFPESLRFDEEKIIILRDEEFFGKKARTRSTGQEDFNRKAKQLNFGDLSPGDLVVHVKHGIGQYEGLRIMNVGGVDNEFIQLSYKDKDKLYLPVYRVAQLQKYSSSATASSLDKLGGTGWEKTKTQVKKHLRDIASDLVALYAKRKSIERPSFEFDDEAITKFENDFPYDETEDQQRAIDDIRKDLSSLKPMDRLVCGDVGFGKTEVAMRAVFLALQNFRQVAVLAPTTVLTFQHFENFKKRFEKWPYRIEVLNRFATPADVKKIIAGVRSGDVHLVIGTHRILSKDIEFKDLGLLIVDEEQKFGVTHKEKIKKLRTNVDTLTLSATPIPRTLNMSLMGIRDLSLINTAPVDRLPTRTFVSKFDETTIKKAITAEISRGGQVYFIHNRVQSIYGIADEVRSIVPEARIRVAHGQMEEEDLEKTMLAFFHHEIDVLICTSIVESGMDVPRANTMFIESAHMFGLSQLYQLRGRVGRSHSRAYCFLMLPRGKQIEKAAQERLKIIQENTELGSGIKIAQYDLELRGSGNLLGEDQSGHVNSVGYELYMDLMNEALAEAKGEKSEETELDPEINLRVPALIPETYIPDIRLRLSYYKALAEIRSQGELDQIEEDLRDQFGEIPEPTLNLMGLMLIRRQCKDLGIRDIGAGVKNISLVFTEKTKLKPQTVIQLATRENKKYSLTPDQRLNVRMNNITWSNVYEELSYLISLV